MTDAHETSTRAGLSEAVERARLVRLCRHLTGDPHVAEDLAQETLLEAWRAADKLHDPAGRPQWVAAIAHNVCRRWLRSRSLDLAHRADVPPDQLDHHAQPAHAGDGDPEAQVEQRARAALLRRALARIPPSTRALLIERYVYDAPHADIARRHGLTEPAVWMRINRGKHLLKQVLTTDLRPDLAACDLPVPDPDLWQETRIWCSGCGRYRLLGRFVPGHDLELDCPQCIHQVRMPAVRGRFVSLVSRSSSVDLLAGISGFKPAMTRIYRAFHAFYVDGIAGRAARCPTCAALAPLRVAATVDQTAHEVHIACQQCGRPTAMSVVSSIALMRPEGRAFWTTHGRIRTLPDRVVEAAGAPAIITTQERVDGGATFSVVFHRATLRVLAVHGGAPP